MQQKSLSPIEPEASAQGSTLAAPPTASLAAPLAAPPFTLEELNALARRYAPIVKLHPQETYLMCSVEWFLHWSSLYGPNGFIKQSPTVADLPVGDKDDGKYWLKMDDAVKRGEPGTARTYVHAYWQPGAGYIDLQYWFCFGYNGPGTLHVSNLFFGDDINLAPLGEHWVDWEQVTVRINIATQKAWGLYLSQHGEGQWLTDLSKFRRQGDQCFVYASKNGHALYRDPAVNPTNSLNLEVIKIYLRNDTADGGPIFNSAEKLELVSADFIPGFVEARWLHFPYRWGRGSDVPITQEAIIKILIAAMAPYVWLTSIAGAAIIAKIALDIAPLYARDNTNGVYGPQTQSYWRSRLIPKYNIHPGYTGSNTNSNTPPGISYFRGAYHIFFMDHGGKGIQHITSIDGINWPRSPDFYTGQNTSAGPYPIVCSDTLFVFYRDGSKTDTNGLLFMHSGDGIHFTRPAACNTGLDCAGQPSVALLGNIQCVVAVNYRGNGLMFSRRMLPNGAWTHGNTGFDTSAPPCIVAYGGYLHVFHRDPHGNAIFHLRSVDGIKWVKSATWNIGFDTSAGPAAVVFEETLYVFFRDGGKGENGILCVESTDGEHFTPVSSWYIGQNCMGQPHIAVSADHSAMCLTCVDAEKGERKNGIMRVMFNPW
jgi:Vacuolar protein sorting-associated protein 62